ncbi:hypothetical protein OG874_02565 [Nocardia sp. NBC_00565]|uniref:hypothetical protein n=1 Tax=Nocardia sp. NBC_00565 TaxID=2975993 RepID=UPI002E8001FA|nr:hypothetical protein [Nocardia sp. NBC_00565]WUC04121.1 hypothetical protein OG874_02565 [Nocardia sp. NBC_00565]
MADDSKSAGPLANLIIEAREGRLQVSIKPEDFVYIDRDCERFKELIRAMQQQATDLSRRENNQWGLGADNAKLTSAQTLVGRFREKAQSDSNSNNLHTILDEHYRIVDDIQTMHREIRDRYMASDAEFAASVRDLLSRLPESPTPIDTTAHQPGVTTPPLQGQPEIPAPQPGAAS